MATVGPNTPGTVTTSGATLYPWVNPSNAATENDTYAGVGNDDPVPVEMDQLVAVGFDMQVPAGATVVGIIVEVGKYQVPDIDGGDAVDGVVQLHDNEVVDGDDYGDTVTAWPSSDDDTYVTYGGSTDLWGLDLVFTNEEIVDYLNSATFGVLISVQITGGGIPNSSYAYVDTIRITVHYTAGAAATGRGGAAMTPLSIY